MWSKSFAKLDVLHNQSTLDNQSMSHKSCPNTLTGASDQQHPSCLSIQEPRLTTQDTLHTSGSRFCLVWQEIQNTTSLPSAR